MATQILKQPAQPRFHLLKDEGSLAGGANMGGLMALPPEFDQSRFASRWEKKGNGVDVMRQRQPIQGTRYTADGWEVWRFPEAPVQSDESKKKGEAAPTAHPRAGQSYEATLTSGTYVLLFRPLDVQQQVEEVYGELSREAMHGEISGQTAGGETPGKGILTEQHLSQIKVLGQEAEAENGGVPVQTVIHSQRSSGSHVGVPRQRVSR